VSKVLNGVRERIDPQTYERVWVHAVKVGYRGKGMTPHAPLTAAGSRQIGVVLRAGLKTFVQSNFFSHVQVGLHEALQPHGFSTVMLGSEDTLDASAAGPLPPALVVLGAVKPAYLRALRQHTRRIVAINGSYPGLCHSVLSNDAQALDLLVEHLIALGHRQLGWLGGLPEHPIHIARFEAFRAALAAHDLPPPNKDLCAIRTDGADRQQGREAALELLARNSRQPTALVCFNGVMARGAVNALLQSGHKLPADVSVVAVDATRVCVEETPHITCASPIPEKLGAAAARLLLDSTGAEDEDFQTTVLSSQLRLGETSGPAK
ncbi:MAG: LacI family DNA-binding transcriptional regulator, partial [Verrucomicrobiota bacterium]